MQLNEEAITDPGWWIDRIVDEMALAEVRTLPTADTPLRLYNTFAKPVAVLTTDGDEVILKAPQVDPRRHRVTRAIFTDQVAGILGRLMGAPVGHVGLVEIPSELIHGQTMMQHMVAGPAHACAFLPDVRDSWQVERLNWGHNRERFASLSVLYGWFGANDRQWLYETADPYRVYSVDHGHFLPGGVDWNTTELRRADPVGPDVGILGETHFPLDELRVAAAALNGIDNATIARAVATPPRGWGIPVSDRWEVARFLAERRVEMIRLFYPKG